MDDRFSYEPPKLESYIGSGIAFGTVETPGRTIRAATATTAEAEAENRRNRQNGSAGCRSPRNRFLRP